MKVFCLLLLLLIGATCVIAESHTDPLDKSPTDSTPPPLLQENKLAEETERPQPLDEPSTKGNTHIAYDIVGMVALLAPEENEDADDYMVRLAITGLLSLVAILLVNILSPMVLTILGGIGLVVMVVGFVESEHKLRDLKRIVGFAWLTSKMSEQ